MTTGTAPSQLGAAGGFLDEIQDCTFSYDTTTFCINNLGFKVGRRLAIVAAAPTTFIQSGATSVVAKDISLKGDPTISDIRWTSAAALEWRLVRWSWTNSGNPRFDVINALHNWIAASDMTQEMRIFGVKVVDVTGAGISGIPVRLTDGIGEVPVDTTTDSAGRISFNNPHPSLGVVADLQNAVAVVDHYGTTGRVYNIRIRNTFLLEANLPSMAGYNASYESYSRKFDWPGTETYTKTFGLLEDVNDTIALGPPPVPASPPEPILVDDVPLPADNEIRIQMTLPEAA
jgi:hypothetical protein